MNRRDFLQLVAAASVVPVAVGRAEELAASRKPLKKGIMLATVGGDELNKLSLADRFQAIRDAGFDGVEAMSHYDRDEVSKAYQKSGLQCASVCGQHHWSKPLSHPSEQVRAEGLEALKHTLEDAAAWGGGSILLVPGVCDQSIPYDVAIERSFVEISKAVPLAEKLQVRISIENVWNNYFLSPVEAASFVDRFHSPWVGWHFDVGNIIHYGWPEQWIHVLGPRINRLHIKEYSRARADKEGKWAGFGVEFLKGDNRWPAVMKALDDIGYHGWGIAEQGGADTIAGLKKLSREMDQIFAS